MIGICKKLEKIISKDMVKIIEKDFLRMCNKAEEDAKKMTNHKEKEISNG